MFCGKCGAENDDKNVFCSVCGARLQSVVNGTTNEADSIHQRGSSNRLKVGAAVAAAFILFVVLIVNAVKDPLVGTWEERSFSYRYGNEEYAPGEGDRITLRKDGLVADPDKFLGYEFGYQSAATIVSWAAEDGNLIFYTKYNSAYYVPYEIKGKYLYLDFGDERCAVFCKT